MAAEIKFAAAQVDVDGLPFEAELSRKWLDHMLKDAGMRGSEQSEAGSVRGRLSRSGRDIVVRGKIRTAVEVDCVRCLRPAEINVRAELALLLRPATRAELRARQKAPGVQEYEFNAHEAEIDTYDGENVVLDDFVREAIILEVPSFPLCRESCPGIPSAPGAAEPREEIDPRLAPLSAFRKKHNGETTLKDLVDAAAARAEAMGRKPILRTNARGKKKKRKGR